jgi:hypothetical protein
VCLRNPLIEEGKGKEKLRKEITKEEAKEKTK